MTTIYFIRHAESDRSVRDGRIRPLTEKGMAERRLVTEFLRDKSIDAVLSSPFKRAVDTVADFAEQYGFEIEIIDDFREQRGDSDIPRDDAGNPLISFLERQWMDLSYKLSDGECITEVQERNIAALNNVLLRYKGKNIVVGTHAMALTAIINHYDNSYGFKDLMAMNALMPWVVRMDFNKDVCIGMEKINLFVQSTK